MLSPSQCRAARALLNWSQPELAVAAYIGVSTIRDFEKGKRSTIPSRLVAMQKAFDRNGVEILYGDQSGARMKAIDACSIPSDAPKHSE